MEIYEVHELQKINDNKLFGYLPITDISQHTPRHVTEKESNKGRFRW